MDHPHTHRPPIRVRISPGQDLIDIGLSQLPLLRPPPWALTRADRLPEVDPISRAVALPPLITRIDRHRTHNKIMAQAGRPRQKQRPSRNGQLDPSLRGQLTLAGPRLPSGLTQQHDLSDAHLESLGTAKPRLAAGA